MTTRELLPHDGSAVLHTDVWAPAEADALFAALLAELPWVQGHITMFGRTVPEPRLSAWHGDPGAAYTYSGRRLDSQPWTATLAGVRSAVERLAGARFDSVLANLYRDGRDAMGWHADDEPELGPEPVIASVSLGAQRRFDLRHRTTGLTVRTELPHGSVLVMAGRCQQAWVHQVARTARVDAPRINLTYRAVGA